MQNILTVKNLEYKELFKDVNCTFKENTFNLITGSNNCGKTTLIKILCGVIESKDNVFIKKTDISSMKSIDISNDIGKVIFNNSYNFSFINMNQEILYKLDKIMLNSDTAKSRYKNLLSMFNLNKYLYLPLEELRNYEKIKLLVLLQLLHSPKILFLDNIFDELTIKESVELISILKKVGNITIIATASNLDLALEFDNLYILNDSKIEYQDSTLEVLKEDSYLNKIGLELPFMVDLSIKLKYYDLVDGIITDMDGMVDKLWK